MRVDALLGEVKVVIESVLDTPGLKLNPAKIIWGTGSSVARAAGWCPNDPGGDSSSRGLLLPVRGVWGCTLGVYKTVVSTCRIWLPL